MKPLALVAATALLAPAAIANADRREASVHVHAVGGPLSMEDDASTAGAGTGALAGLAVRASYATRNAWQYDTQLTLGYGRASFDAGQFLLGGGTPMTVPFTVSSQLARLDAGVTLRLGVRWIPTVRLAVGAPEFIPALSWHLEIEGQREAPRVARQGELAGVERDQEFA